MVQAVSTNTFFSSRFIVDPVASQGTHTTIASAIATAVSGQTIFIRPGTYTENFTLKAGVNLVAYDADALTPNVTIVGKMSYSSAGTVSISGIRLQTNGDFLLEVTGAAASLVNLYNCYLNITNNTGISFTTANASSLISIRNTQGNIGALGIAIFSASSTGSVVMIDNGISNTGLSVTASTMSDGRIAFNYCTLFSPISITAPCSMSCTWSFISTAATNVTAVTIGVGATYNFDGNNFNGGTATALVIGGTGSLTGSRITSSNAATIAGVGTLNFADLQMLGTSNITTTTATELCGGGFIYTGTFTPTVEGSAAAGVTTYTTQTGTFARCGNYVFVNAVVTYTAATGTGDMVIGALPFSVFTDSSFGTATISGAGNVWPAARTDIVAAFSVGAAKAQILATGSAVASAFMQMANTATTLSVTGMYRIA